MRKFGVGEISKNFSSDLVREMPSLGELKTTKVSPYSDPVGATFESANRMARYLRQTCG